MTAATTAATVGSGRQVEIGVLGPLTVRVDGVDVALTAPKERAVLGLLAVRTQVVGADALSLALWGEHPPRSAGKALHNYISNLRRLLPPGIIETHADGYRAAVPDEAVDARRFLALVAEGRGLDGGLPRRAADVLTEAVGLWRGPALGDLGAHPLGQTEAAHLEETRRTAEEDRFEALLACGEHQALVAELMASVDAEPFRERRWGQLMVALYRSGRQAEALRTFQRLRVLLDTELGIDPSTPLVSLEASILRNDAGLAWDASTVPPTGGAVSTGAVDRRRPDPVPIPGRLSLRPDAGVIGRTTEAEELRRACKRVSSGEGREVVLLSGEAGIGKTTLVAEVARAAAEEGAFVLFGHCEEDLATPYQLFAEALGHYVAHADGPRLAAQVATHGPELLSLVPALAEHLPGLPPSTATDSDAERYLLFAGVVGLLARLSADEPVVLVLDDLQWADRGSLQLLVHLAASEVPMRVLVVGVYRDAELPQAVALRETLGALHRHRGISRVELGGFDEVEVLALMEATAGQRLDDAAVDLARAVHVETDGNPFFVNEVLRHLAETGAIYQDADGRWLARGDIASMVLPGSVREVVSGRVGRLGRDAEQVLSLAAVIGRDFDLELLALASRRTEDDLLEVLDAAAVVDLVHEPSSTPGHFTFAHALIQHTLYEGLGPTRRARCHRTVAEALEALCGDHAGGRVGELARHWLLTGSPVDRAKALASSHRAADAALTALAPAEALGHYRRALDVFALLPEPDPATGLDLAIGYGTAQRQTGDAGFRVTLLEAARRAADLGDTGRLVAAALANDRGFTTTLGTVDVEKVEILETARARLPGDHPDRALVLAALCSELAYGSSFEQRLAWAEEAFAIARSHGDDATLVRVLNHTALPLSVPSQLEGCLARSAEALETAQRIGDPSLAFWAATLRQHPVIWAGDIVELDRCLAISGDLAVQFDEPSLVWLQHLSLATRALIAGDTAEAERMATTALELGTAGGQPDAEGLFAPQYMEVCWQRGTLADLVPFIEQAIAERPDFPVFTAALAMAHSDGDHLHEALGLLEAFAGEGFRFPMDVTWLSAMTAYAEAAIEARAAAESRQLFDRLLPWADQLPYTGTTTEGPVSHFLGGLATVLGRYDEADEFFEQADRRSAAIGARFFGARTDLLRGRMLVERGSPGDTERARELLDRAHRTAVTMGYGTVERRAAAALAGLSSSPASAEGASRP